MTSMTKTKSTPDMTRPAFFKAMRANGFHREPLGYWHYPAPLGVAKVAPMLWVHGRGQSMSRREQLSWYLQDLERELVLRGVAS